MENNKFNIVDDFEVKLWNFEKKQKKDGSYSDKIFIGRASFSTYLGEYNGQKQYVNMDVQLNFFRKETGPYTNMTTDYMVKKFNEKLGDKDIRLSGTMALDYVSKTIKVKKIDENGKETEEKQNIRTKAMVISIATDENGKYRVAPKGENNG